ncbi:glutathione S-transferase [Nitrosomonas sp. Nm51]|uniref:glutathione S-transferase C-terminal domain-containing protein n=1 Tax=Nitrosomonas sp. Nm51 TaxID=133720 RepID=UPI0008B0E4EF|nr:glutathione S-transferase C-terminal domain-containing protein [Nitrosomonas sp. Nm51]SER33959.1 glutathione S-transferase [Nitrosomonas sp. Nm51]
MPNDKKPVKVLSFSPSADGELNRWILFYYGIDFKESRHTVPFFFLLNKLQGGKSLVLCRDGDVKLTSVHAVIKHFDAQTAPEFKLIPEALAESLESGWNRYNTELGGAAVKWAYTNLLPYKTIMVRPLSLGSPWLERFFVKHWYSIPKRLIWKSQQLSKAAADESLKTIKAIFEEVDRLLADGRTYLYGERLTLADFAFAVSGAPLVLPANYGGDQFGQGPIPTLEEFPLELQATIRAMRQTPAGEFILRLYAQDRYRSIRDHS